MANPPIPIPDITRILDLTMTERWKTTACQCGGFESCVGDWLCAFLFPPAAGAMARQNVDGTNCCYAMITAPPEMNYNVVRRRYEIIGDDGEDAIFATFCMPCAMRRALTESRMRGPVRNWGPFKWEPHTQQTSQWTLGLCACTVETFCYALLLPFCLSAQARSRFDGSSCCFNVFCTTPFANNTMIREGYGIEGNECLDCLVMFLYPCALQRMYTEATIKFLMALAAKGQEMLKKCCPCCGK